jgi:hypothetical protein
MSTFLGYFFPKTKFKLFPIKSGPKGKVCPNLLTWGQCYKFFYSKCRVLFIVMLNIIMLSVIMMNVVMLSVVAPAGEDCQGKTL